MNILPRRNLSAVIAVGVLVALLAVVPMLPRQGGASAQSVGTSACPSNEIFHLGYAGGTPNAFNLLTAVEPGAAFGNLMWLYLYPEPSPTGVLDYNQSVVDWYSVSSNHTVWTFNVKPGLMWSDGTPVTAQDILNTYSPSYALNASVDFVNAAPMIVKEYALNTSAAVFVLNASNDNLAGVSMGINVASNAHFGELMGSNVFEPVMPKQMIALGPTASEFGVTDVADGPFYAVNYTSGATQAIFMRNPYYKPLPKICEIIMNFYESNTLIPPYIQSNTVQLGQIPSSQAATVSKSPNVGIMVSPGNELLVLNYNISVYPYSALPFREALAYGVNQTLIQQQAFGGYDQVASSAEGGVPPITQVWYNSSQTSYTYDPAHATSLLASMGITKGSNGYLDYSNGTAVKLNIWYDTTHGTGNVLTSTIVQSELEQLGFQVTTIAATTGTMIGDTYSNTNNIDNAIILTDSGGPLFGFVYTDSLPSYLASEIPYAPTPSWEGLSNSTSEANYQSNVTALLNTTNPALEHLYIGNIQELNAQTLPEVILGYPDRVWGYNTQDFTNFPVDVSITGTIINQSALAQIAPVSTGVTTTSSSSSISQSITTTSSGIAPATSTSTTFASTTTATSSSSKSSSTSANLLIVAIVMILLVIGAVMVMVRRTPAKA